MKIFFRILALALFASAIFHSLNYFGLPEGFAPLNTWFRVWSVVQVVLELYAGAQLLRLRNAGIYTFYVLFYIKIVAYSLYSQYFQYPTLWLCLQIGWMATYMFLAYRVVATDMAKSLTRKPKGSSV